jgi:hypothetical protein
MMRFFVGMILGYYIREKFSYLPKIEPIIESIYNKIVTIPEPEKEPENSYFTIPEFLKSDKKS